VKTRASNLLGSHSHISPNITQEEKSFHSNAVGFCFKFFLSEEYQNEMQRYLSVGKSWAVAGIQDDGHNQYGALLSLPASLSKLSRP